MENRIAIEKEGKVGHIKELDSDNSSLWDFVLDVGAQKCHKSSL